MKERAPTFVAVALLLILVCGTWWAANYAQKSIPIDPPRRVTHDPNSWARDFVMVRTDDQGIAINRIEGKFLQHYPDDDSYKITTATAISQQPNTPVTVGTSRTAVMDQNGSRVIMQGDAHIHRPGDKDHNPLDVTSQELTLLPDQDIVYTNLPALVVNGDSTMHGTGMRYNNKTSILQVFSASDVKISGKDVEKKQAAKADKSSQPDKKTVTQP